MTQIGRVLCYITRCRKKKRNTTFGTRCPNTDGYTYLHHSRDPLHHDYGDCIHQNGMCIEYAPNKAIVSALSQPDLIDVVFTR